MMTRCSDEMPEPSNQLTFVQSQSDAIHEERGATIDDGTTWQDKDPHSGRMATDN